MSNLKTVDDESEDQLIYARSLNEEISDNMQCEECRFTSPQQQPSTAATGLYQSPPPSLQNMRLDVANFGANAYCQHFEAEDSDLSDFDE